LGEVSQSTAKHIQNHHYNNIILSLIYFNMVADETIDLIAILINKTANEELTYLQVISKIMEEHSISKSKVESAYYLAREFGFIVTDSDKLIPSKEGKNFHRYIDILKEGKKPPVIQKTTNILTVTLPPRWSISLSDKSIGEYISTINAQRKVLERSNNRLVVITPFIDPAVLQMIIPDYYPEKECIVITSEKKLKYENSYVLDKLRDVLERRFGLSKIYFYSELSMILHGKIWLSDLAILITSANIKSDSVTDNFEIGVYSEDPSLIMTTTNLVNKILTESNVECL